MAQSDLFIAGMGLSQNVVANIVCMAVRRVEGVCAVGGNDVSSGLVSVFTKKKLSTDQAVEASVEDDKLHITVHLSVFYGYPFDELAADVRSAVALAVKNQIGVGTAAVDVCIDALVFPKA